MKQLGSRAFGAAGVILAGLLSACSGPGATPAAAPHATGAADPGPASAAPHGQGEASASAPNTGSKESAVDRGHKTGGETHGGETTGSNGAGDEGPGEKTTAGPPLDAFTPQQVERVRTEPVSSLALDPQKHKIAALGQPPMIRERDRWRALPLPASMAAPEGAREATRIHFGRDNQPRIMGTRWLADGAIEQVYLRYRKGRWKREPRELAAFAARPPAPLYGVLGLADPEVLCKLGKRCLIKQRSGWSEVPLPVAPPALPIRIDVTGDRAYALLDEQLLRLGKKAWHEVGARGAWREQPAAAWLSDGEAWVSVPGENALYRHADGSWQRLDAPLAGPRGLWRDARGQLWLAADGGAAVQRQGRWQRVAGIEGPLSEVVGHGPTVYFAGRSGLWAARLPAGAGEGKT